MYLIVKAKPNLASPEVCFFAEWIESDLSIPMNLSQLISSTQVIPLKSLKREYKPFLSRRRLAAKYDMFLADERVFRLMHVHLGKEFYSIKK